MRNYFRAVQYIFRQPAVLAASAVCCLMVAVLWGVNLSGAGPLVDVVIRGKSFHQWLDEETSKAQTNVAQFDAEIARLEKELAVATSAANKASLEKELKLTRERRRIEQKYVAGYRRLAPLIARYAPSTPFTTLLLLIGALFVGTLLKDLFLVGHICLVGRLTERTLFDLRSGCYRHALQMDLASMSEMGASDLMSRMTYDLQTLGQGLNSLYGKMVREPLKMAACLIGAAIICWRLLLVSVIVAPLAMWLIGRLGRSLKRASRRALTEMSHLYGRLSETLQAVEVVKAFTMEDHECRKFDGIAKNYYRKSMRIVFYNALLKPSTELFGIGIVCLAVVFGGYLVLNQATHLWGIPMTNRPLGIGAMMAFFTLLIGAADPIRKLSDVLGAIQRGGAAADRVFSVIDRQSLIADPAAPKSPLRPHGELVFENVNFHYQPAEPVLRNIDLRVSHGETLAIVGANGCGKSTLTNLIPRFHDPVEGVVRLDDVDLKSMALEDLRGRIGLVTQRAMLFNDTVFNNIRYGSPQASEADVLRAARQAHAHDFIENRLEHGYQTKVGEGGNRLSGGQRQRIALARAILRDPDILILDEATSQIDLKSEQLIHRTLRTLLEGRTAIMITHRLTTLELADRVLVMDAGAVVDIGAHEELLSRCDLYRRLYQMQFKAA